MTSFVRRVAGGLTVVVALWLFYAYFDSPAVGPVFVPTNSIASPALAVLLLLVGALEVWGVSIAYGIGAVLSAAALVVTGCTVIIVHGYEYLSTASNDAIIGVAFALVAILINLEAIRSKSNISEQANPMNLPVFG